MLWVTVLDEDPLSVSAAEALKVVIVLRLIVFELEFESVAAAPAALLARIAVNVFEDAPLSHSAAPDALLAFATAEL